MNFYLIDAGGAGLLYYAVFLGALFMVLATLLEAVAMILMKYNTPFKKAIGDSMLVNLASLAVGFLLIVTSINLFDNKSALVNLLILYAITLVVEVPILYQLNRSKPFKRTLVTGMVMNLVTYLLLFLFNLNS